MKFKHIAILAATSIVSLELVGTSSHINAYPCAGANSRAASDSAPRIHTEFSTGRPIRRTDPVTYFIEEKAVAGESKYETTWNNTVWHFSSAENQKLFESDPEAYAS